MSILGFSGKGIPVNLNLSRVPALEHGRQLSQVGSMVLGQGR